MGCSVHEHESQQQQPGVSDCTGAVLYLCSGSSIKIMKSVPQHEVAAAGNGMDVSCVGFCLMAVAWVG